MPRLVKDSVKKTIVRMAVPMLAGTFAMNAYHLTDTWFVSRLGTDALAAMSFTFPVVMLLRFITRGLSAGAMTLVAHALGRKDHKTAATLATHAMFLSLICVGVISLAGLMTIGPLFRQLGAGGEVLTLVEQYMRIWYLGIVFMVIPMMANDVIIAAGDSKAASLLLVGGTVLNTILDPIMIFGFFGFPRMGISGAALATILSQAVMCVGAFEVLGEKHRLLSFADHSWEHIVSSWKRILHIGIPSTISSILTPLAIAVVTRIVAGFGYAAVAACGAAGRIEMFAFMIPMTVGMSLLPFVGQNYGAQRVDRIKEARKFTFSFALIFGAVTAGIFQLTARPLAGLFSNDPKVVTVLVQYMTIISLGYGFTEAHRYAGFYLTGIHRPVSAAVLTVIRVFVLLVPLSFIGARLFGITGVFGGRLLTDVLAGVIGIIWSGRALKSPALLGGAGRR